MTTRAFFVILGFLFPLNTTTSIKKRFFLENGHDTDQVKNQVIEISMSGNGSRNPGNIRVRILQRGCPNRVSVRTARRLRAG
jgi:hypothetical protein